MALSATTTIILIFICIFQCTPISLAWNFWTGESHGHCLNVNHATWGNAATTLFFDLVILGLPLKPLYNLNLSWRKKIQIMSMFGLGIFTTVISVYRLFHVARYAHASNFTYDQSPLLYISQVEVDSGIICASMPFVKPIFDRLWMKYTKNSTDSGSWPKASGTKSELESQNTMITKTIRHTIKRGSEADASIYGGNMFARKSQVTTSDASGGKIVSLPGCQIFTIYDQNQR